MVFGPKWKASLAALVAGAAVGLAVAMATGKMGKLVGVLTFAAFGLVAYHGGSFVEGKLAAAPAPAKAP